MEQWKVSAGPETEFCLPLPEECQGYLQGQFYGARNPNPMAELMIFLPSPFFFCCLCPHAHLEAPNMASFEDFFSLFSMLPCLYPHLTPVILLGELFCLTVTTINS